MSDPLVLFLEWHAEARREPPINPDAVALATATPGGRPSARIVFYRGIREGGFSFFTNYDSRKGRELAENPFGALAFYWPHLGRQVRVEGAVVRLSAEESDAYFQSRSFESQVTAVVSRQSQPLEDADEFQAEVRELENSNAGKQVLRPGNWGGFKLMPEVFEFWTRGEHRRHERIVYRREGDAWRRSRLYP